MPEGILYHIIRADKEGCPAIPDLIFADPALASEKARELSREMGEKLMVKIIVNDKWKLREQKRVDDGVYRPLPWINQAWWAGSYPIHRDHFAHPSMERAGWIAYTKSAEDGMKDKQTVVRPGTYLKLFERELGIYGASERRLVESFMAQYGPIDVKFATTADDIHTLYENGYGTCMQGRDWHDGQNPAALYANGDLQVAYLGDLENCKARALVWPEKKIHSRVYGDIARLTNGLQRLGYKWGAPIGAKIKRIQIREVKFNPGFGNVSRCFVAPYIDKRNQAGGGHLSVFDRGDHLEICEEGMPGSHHCGLADGYSGLYVPRLDEYPTFTCEQCGAPGFRELTTVLDNPEDGEEFSWCRNCVKEDAFQCRYSGSFFMKDVPHVPVDLNLWARYYADMYAGRCEITGVLTAKENLLEVWIDGNRKKVHSQWARDRGVFKSGASGRYFLKHQRKTCRSLDGNFYLANQELKYHAFQCDQCEEHWALRDRIQVDGDKLICPNCNIQQKNKNIRDALQENRPF